jgi:peptidyl-prolyl cis-trans isomerase-like 3
MAKKHPNTNKSQFYIIYEEQSQLNNVDTAIGKVIYGMDTLRSMESVPVNEKYRPQKEIVIKNITIHANPFAPL